MTDAQSKALAAKEAADAVADPAKAQEKLKEAEAAQTTAGSSLKDAEAKEKAADDAYKQAQSDVAAAQKKADQAKTDAEAAKKAYEAAKDGSTRPAFEDTEDGKAAAKKVADAQSELKSAQSALKTAESSLKTANEALSKALAGTGVSQAMIDAINSDENLANSSYGFFEWLGKISGDTTKNDTALKYLTDSSWTGKEQRNGTDIGTFLSYTHLGNADDATSLKHLGDAIKLIYAANQYRANDPYHKDLQPLKVSTVLMALAEINANWNGRDNSQGSAHAILVGEDNGLSAYGENQAMRGSTWKSDAYWSNLDYDPSDGDDYGTNNGKTDADSPYDMWYLKERYNWIQQNILKNTANHGETGHYEKNLMGWEKNGITGVATSVYQDGQWYYANAMQEFSDESSTIKSPDGTFLDSSHFGVYDVDEFQKLYNQYVSALKARASVKQAKENVAAAQKAYDQAKKDAESKQSDLDNANEAYETAKAAYDESVEADVAKAKQASDAANAALTAANNELANAKSKESAAKDALDQADAQLSSARQAKDAADAKVAAARTNLENAKAGGEAAKAKLAEAKQALDAAKANLASAKDAKAAADEALSKANSDLEAAKATAASAREAAKAARADAGQKAAALKALTDAKGAYEAAQKAASDAADAAKAAQAKADEAKAKAAELSGKQAGLDEAAKAAQAKADALKAIADELAKLPSDDAFLADPTTVEPTVAWLDAYAADVAHDADAAAAAKGYASRLAAAERSAKDALAMQGQVDADQEAADVAKAEADEAKAALDQANQDLAIKQAIDRAMAEKGTAKEGAGTGKASVKPASYVPQHMAQTAGDALPNTGDTTNPAAPFGLAVGFISLAAAVEMKRRNRA